ncbi:transglutaminase-like cysteine peptidase [Salidesulfovibrio onnuriiensis]|uniref:transglutaminase-like cysteine peptidase n=1 Tax=Salidesulfovibrio onnuriiensis TaxID=2583823 RepID=UPI0011C9156B|nr:transglutaminase-like cysteine peptidase [Salidesulfovibrio onnuriiensis]
MAAPSFIPRAARGLLYAVLVAACLAVWSASGVRAADKAQPPRLFNTLEFKGKIKKLPKWMGVLRRMALWRGYFKDSSMDRLPSKAGWLKLKKSVAGKPPLERLKAVNRYFNQWPYRLDMSNYGQRDYWATPVEFLKKSGDCEDYAIAKYYALKELGFSPGQMRIVAVRDMIRNIGHAVLAVYLPDDIYILDNQTVMVLSHKRYTHYVPQYSVNERFRWMHVPPMKKKKTQAAPTARVQDRNNSDNGTLTAREPEKNNQME